MASPHILPGVDGTSPLPTPPVTNEGKAPRRSSFTMTMTHLATTTTTTTHIHTLPKTKHPTHLSSASTSKSKPPTSLLSSHKSSSSDPPHTYESSSSQSEIDCDIQNRSMPVQRQQNHATSSSGSHSRGSQESRSRKNSSDTPVPTSLVPTSSEEKKREHHRTEWKWEVAVIGVEHPIFATIFGVVLGISGAVVSVVALLVVHVIPSFRLKPPPPVSLSNSTSGRRGVSSRNSPPPTSTAASVPLISIFNPSKAKTPSLSSATIVGDGTSTMKRVTFQLGGSNPIATVESVYLPLSHPSAISGGQLQSPSSPSASTSETLVNSPERPPLTITDSSGSGVSGQSSLISPDGSVESSHTTVSATFPNTSCPPISFGKEKKLWRSSGKSSSSPCNSDAEASKSSNGPKRQMSIKIPGFKSLRRRSLPAGPTTASHGQVAMASIDLASHESPTSSQSSVGSLPVGAAHCAQQKSRSKTFSFLSPTDHHVTTSPNSISAPSACPFSSHSSSQQQAPRPRTNPYLPPFNAIPRTNSTRRMKERQRVSSDASVPRSLSGSTGVAASDVESSAGEEALRGTVAKRARRAESLDLQGRQPSPLAGDPATEFGERKASISGLGLGRPSTSPKQQRVISDSSLVVPPNHHNVASPSPLRSIVASEPPSRPTSHPPSNDAAASSDRDSLHQHQHHHHKSPLANLGSKVKRRFSLRNSEESTKSPLAS